MKKITETAFIRGIAFILHALSVNMEFLPVYKIKVAENVASGNPEEISNASKLSTPKGSADSSKKLKKWLKPWAQLQAKRNCGQSQRSSRENHAHIPPLKRK